MTAAIAKIDPFFLPTKAKPIKRLSMKHRRVIALHLQGYDASKIASAMGLKAPTVYAILRNPTVQGIISQAISAYDDDIAALMGPAIGTVRFAMEQKESSLKEALRAADMAIKMNGKYRDVAEKGDTAEDVIQRIYQIESEGPVSIKVAEQVTRRG